ncbi:RhoGAP-domain-containing protein [Backusella circina FSU 941]|nr:RhoGAP-domain-containing protein [Backusella circina FSU 941]
MESIRRALTTSSRKKDRSATVPAVTTSTLRRDQRSYSLHTPSAPPLYISLPDLEKEHHTTPPLSPPSANQQIWIIPSQLAEITTQQDNIVRHVAILYMDEHIDSNDNLIEELLALLESKKASSLWGKLKTHILTTQQDGNGGALYSNKKIGVSLSCLDINKPITINAAFVEKCKTMCPSMLSLFSEHSQVPKFLGDCILVMIDKDLKTEGIFRKNGNIRGLKEMCEALDTMHHDDMVDFFKEQQIVQLAAFIKRFLRELPEPILTFKLHKLFLLSITKGSSAETLAVIHYGICILPKVNRDILLLILGLLFWVSRHADANKMNADNLARVMAPNMLYPSKQQLSSIEASAGHGEIEVPSDFSILLQHPKMVEYICTNGIDLTSSKHFIRTYSNLMKVKKQVGPALPPSPSLSTNYK